MNNPIEKQQANLMTLIAKYKVLNNQYKTRPKINISFYIAILSFTASILSFVFGCLCFSDCKIFNYIITGIVILLFIVILGLQLLDYAHFAEKLRIKRCKLAEKGITVKCRKATFELTLRRRTIKRELIKKLSENQNDNERVETYEAMTEEQLLDECVKVCSTEESITIYESHLSVIDQLIAEQKKKEKIIKRLMILLSFVAIMASVIYIVINCVR